MLSSLVHLAGADASSAATIAATQSGDESLFTKIGNFASDNATWFIVGLIALAVILAAFFIIRAGRKGKTADGSPTGKAKVSPAQPRTTAGAAATSAAASQPTAQSSAQPSAAEMKRRRRAAMQRAREEERLRRQGARSAPKQPSAQMDPVEAEKAAARGQTPVAPAGSEAGQPPVPPPAGEAPTAVTPPAPSAAAGAVAAGAAAGAMAGRVESADAEERLREKVEQIKAGQTGAPVPPPAAATPAPPTVGASAESPTTPVGDRGGAGPGEVAPDLADAERRLQADRAIREQTLGDAEVRLRELEARAEAAERRAAFAEQLANLRAEEGEQERRLNEVLSRIDRAEHRAQMAEIRAEEAERTASEALRGGSAHVTRPPQPPPVAPAPQAVPPSPPPSSIATPPPATQGGLVNINTAGFEELRTAELSVTQATRVMAYRERFGGYGSIEDLGRVPGFTPDVVEALRGRLTT
ncbi:MAG: ComEA family DNA-binding protein [Solirubrobacterales bacterium]